MCYDVFLTYVFFSSIWGVCTSCGTHTALNAFMHSVVYFFVHFWQCSLKIFLISDFLSLRGVVVL